MCNEELGLMDVEDVLLTGVVDERPFLDCSRLD